TGWPEDLRVLIARYPREQWKTHANLGDMARFWLSRHAMFRELSAGIEGFTSHFRAGSLSPSQFAREFTPRLQFMLDQLNVHHQTEDLFYSPFFRNASSGFPRGFDGLEAKPPPIHGDMARPAATANALLQALKADGDTLVRCGDEYAGA